LDTPTVSVITTVYNGGPWIAETIRSVLAQTAADFEYVLVDDGSADDSADIIRRFAAADRRIRPIFRGNGGIAAARNTGLEAARGRYAAMLDHDDLCEPRRLEAQVRRMDRQSACVVLGTRVLMIDAAGRPIGPMGGLPCGHADIERALLGGRNPIAHTSVMLRRRAVLDAGGYRVEHSGVDDYDLFLRLAERGRAANLPAILCRYRQHFGSFQHLHYLQQSARAAVVLREAFARRRLDPDAAPPALAVQPRPQYELHARWFWSAIKAGNAVTALRHFGEGMGKLVRGLWRGSFD
jgi:glycosyltransferase involved in cell wall biosynthesis